MGEEELEGKADGENERREGEGETERRVAESFSPSEC